MTTDASSLGTVFKCHLKPHSPRAEARGGVMAARELPGDLPDVSAFSLMPSKSTPKGEEPP